MIISPPFLSLRELSIYDEQCVDQAMPGGFIGSGAFPVSMAMGWHGGIHIHAPTADEPVRAIADGVVVFRRDAATINYADKDTSTGCVVIRHTTEIGADDSNKPVNFIYYSITLHLSKLDEKLPKRGEKVYRKDKLGLAGKIHGDAPRIHFEIVVGDKDIEALTGRTTGRISLQNHGRTSVVYGTSYVFVPGAVGDGIPYFTTNDAPSSKPAIPMPAASGFIKEDLVIGIRYAEGDGHLDSYQLNGTPVGTVTEPNEGEYRLYERCVALHKATNTASPSGWHELLRFGRKMGPDDFPAEARHWRKVKLPGGIEAWIDLNASGTKKYSDADFPHFMGWRLVDDDSTDDNSCCESAAIARFLNTTPEGDPVAEDTPQSRMRRLCDTDVQKKLAKTICKFPSEWVAEDVQKRWEWITKPDNPYKPEPTDAVGFTKVQEFANALCFWADLFDEDKTRLTTKHWHFHPREFIIQMRKCGWLSTKELAQCIPRQAIEQTTSATGTRLYPSSIINWNTAISRAENYCVDINKMFRKYGISSKKTRISYFLGNSIQETIYFSRKSELGGSGARYAPWYGRGFLQLTWEENYRNYGDFKGWSQLTTASFRDSLETDDEIATDSAGYYWLTCAKKLPNAVCLNRYSESAPTLTLSTLINVCLNYDYHTRTCVGGTTTMNYYASTESEQVARAVNTGNANSTGVVNGLIPRNNVLANVVNVLLEADELNVKKQRE